MHRIIFLLLFSINIQAQFSIKPSPTESFVNASVAFFNVDSQVFNGQNEILTILKLIKR